MRFKKLVSILLATTVAVSLLATGCTKTEKKAENSTTTESTKEQPKKPMSVMLYDRGNTPAEEGTIDNNRWTKWIKENVHAEITFVTVPRWESAQKLNVMFAANNAPDLIPEYDINFKNQLYAQKKIIPVNDMIEKYSTNYKKLLQKYPDLKKATTYDDGKIYELGAVANVTPNHAMLIRTDWLKKLNLKVPETVEELTEVARAFAEKDPDGNGAKDTFGMNFSFVGGYLVERMFGNVSPIFEEGQPVKDWTRTKDQTAFMKQLYDAGAVDKEYMLDKNGQKAQQDWVNGKLGIFGANGGVGGNTPYRNYYETLKKNVPTAQVDAIPLPKSKYGQYAPTIDNPVRGIAVVNVGAKNLDAIMNYVDFFAAEDTVKKFKTGPDGNYAKLNDKGYYENAVSDDIIKKEASYNGDIGILNSRIFMPTDPFDGMSMKEAGHKEWQQVRVNGYKAYLNKDLKFAPATWYSPSLPPELTVVSTTLTGTDNKITNILVKAVTSGSAYSVDQAITDAKDAWEKGGGKQLEDAWKKWYDQNKSNLVTYESVVSGMKSSYEAVLNSLK